MDDNNKKDHENVGMKLSDFKILKELGKGSYGKVYTVRSYIDDNEYVMKKMELNHLKPKQQRECYREVSILKKVNHPNIIKYYSSFLEQENLYIIMEYAENGDLFSLIKHYKRHKKLFEEFDIWRIASEILNGLHYLHTHNIIHRDIKCLNLFITKDKHVKIGDLGVSTIVSSINALHCTRVGTPLYLSPELVKQIPYDYKVDMWSFGCSLYHLCMLDPPFTGDNLIALGNSIVKGTPKPIPSQYSTDLVLFIDRLLSKKPERRPSAKEAIGMIPKDIMEKIKEANRNKVEIKNRPFSSVGNRIITINKEEIKKIGEKIIDEKKEKEKEKKNNQKNNEKEKEKEKENEKEKSVKNDDDINIKEDKNKNVNEIKKLEIINVKNGRNIPDLFRDNITFNNRIKTEINIEKNNGYSPRVKDNSNFNKGNNQFSKLNFIPNINHNKNKFSLPFANKIIGNHKPEKSVKIFANDFKEELKELQKEKNKKSIIEAIEKKKEPKKEDENIKNDNKIELININSNNINIINIEKKKEENQKSLTEEKIQTKKKLESLKEKIEERKENIEEKKEKDPFEINLPNLREVNQNFEEQNQNININNFKRILSSKKPRLRANRPYTANNRILNQHINKNPNTFRPMTGIKQNNINNNIINININFFNIDMNRKFLSPNLDIFKEDDNNKFDISIVNNAIKRPHSHINLRKITGNANEFFFNKIIKTLEEANGKRKLTIKDVD